MPRSVGFAVLWSTMQAAVQWRLLLLWLLIMAMPTVAVVLPLWQMLGGLLDNSVHATEWARHFNAVMFTDIVLALSDHAEWLGASAMIGVGATLLLSSYLNGMIVGSGRAGRALGFGALLQNGLIEYGRMFRVMLWSLLPYALVIGAWKVGGNIADKHAENAVLESQANLYAHVIQVFVLIVFVLVQSMVESARAAFIADITLRSATRAMWRGIRQCIRRPVKTVSFYVLVTLAGVVLATLFGMARIHVTTFGVVGFLFALLLSQLIVLTMGWMRTARLFALAEVARTVVPARVQAEYR
ncbi:hypothetical protein [Dyella sp. M7H15-1]|uniref:hypothetical protein n=1 Tax=Dyella sp. M7H15-1 TaxID=2501295 RepID=UPI001F0C71F9|nr:hypothetical protein [Dyella sp. M7H15-1]